MRRRQTAVPEAAAVVAGEERSEGTHESMIAKHHRVQSVVLRSDR